MTIVFMEGFDAVDRTDILRKWTYASNIANVTTGLTYAYAAKGQGCYILGGDYIRKAGLANIPTFVFGYYYYFPNTTAYTLVQFLDGSNNEQCSIRTDGSGHITLSRNGTTLATSANSYSAGQYRHIEVKITIHNTTGAYQLKVDGVDWIAAATGANTRAQSVNYINGFQILGQSSYFDDVYFLDCASAPNNDFLGPVKVMTLLPEAAGNYAQWTSNWGANFNNVNRLGAHDDTVFNQSATVDQADTFKFTNVGDVTIKGIAINLIARQDAGLARTMARLARQSSTDRAGTPYAPAITYGTYFEVLETDPNEAPGTAWTAAALNAAEFGYKVAS